MTVRNSDSTQYRFSKYISVLKQDPDLYQLIEATDKVKNLDSAGRLYLYVFIPAIIGFVQWVIEQAYKKGHKRLYFLSRDGYQMYLAAKKIIQIRKLEMEARYLNVSRYSMRIPEYALNLDRAIDLITVNGIDVTLNKILKRAGLTDGEISDVIQSMPVETDPEQILGYSQIMNIRKQLKGNMVLYQYISDHSKPAYNLAIAYLRQEGLLDSKECAIVDSGWIGTLQQSIETLLKHEEPESKVDGYYFGMYEIPAGMMKDQYHAYYFSSNSGIRRKARFANSLFEAVVSADEGMTIAYKNEKGKIIAVKDKDNNPNQQQMKENIGIMETFLTNYHHSLNNNSMLRLTEKLFQMYMSEPTVLEVSCYGDNVFSDDIRDDKLKKVAAELTEQEIRDQRFFNKLATVIGANDHIIRESAWIEGSIVRCGGNVKSNLRHARMYKYFVYFRKQIKSR